jgi:hypothetical protein
MSRTANAFAIAHKSCAAPIGAKVKAGRIVTVGDTAYTVDGRTPQFAGRCVVCSAGVAQGRLWDAVLLAA